MTPPAAICSARVRRVLRAYSSLLVFLGLVWWATVHWVPLANSALSIPIGSGRAVYFVTWSTFIRLPEGSSGGGEHWLAIWYQDRPNGPFMVVWGTTLPLWPLILPVLGLSGVAVGLKVWRHQRQRKLIDEDSAFSQLF
jgi:hypothetical protein